MSFLKLYGEIMRVSCPICLGVRAVDGEARVTTSKKVLDGVNGHFASSAKD